MPGSYEEVSTSIEDANEYLVERGAVGILIGGIAAGIHSGETDEELKSHKDLDILVLSSKKQLDHESKFDLFFKEPQKGYTNRVDAVLPYHIHLDEDVLKNLKPGLYTIPFEAIQLIEVEMKTRRALDRVLPDALDEKSHSGDHNSLNLEDIILEFPGDISWLGKNLPKNTILQIYRKYNDEVGSRTFITFGDPIEPENLPETAFPESKLIRAPEAAITNVLPNPELTDEWIYELGMQLIKEGFIEEGMSYILEMAPLMADNSDLVDFICEIAPEDDALAQYNALNLWLVKAKERQFTNLLLLNAQFCKKWNIKSKDILNDTFNKIGKRLIKMYGTRYFDLAAQLQVLDNQSIFADMDIDEIALPEEVAIKILNILTQEIILSKSKDIFEVATGDKNFFKFPVDIDQFLNDDEQFMFNDFFVYLLEVCGVTKDEFIKKSLDDTKSLNKIRKKLEERCEISNTRFFEDSKITIEQTLEATAHK